MSDNPDGPSMYERLRSELRLLTNSVYIVNQKNPRTYDREWSIYCWYLDDSKETVLTRDTEAARNQAMRECIVRARNRTPENTATLVPCPTCDGGAIGFGQTNAGIFKRCPQCDGRTEVPTPENTASPRSTNE